MGRAVEIRSVLTGCCGGLWLLVVKLLLISKKAAGCGDPQPAGFLLVDIVHGVIDVEFAGWRDKFGALDDFLEFTGLVIYNHDG